MWDGTRRYRPVIALTLIVLIFSSFHDSSFLTSGNIQNLLSAVAVLWVIAIGQTFVLITGGADLSTASVATLIGIFLTKTINGIPEGLDLLFAVIFGFLIGAVINGTLIGRLRLGFFVVTLATSTALGGVATLWSGGVSQIYNHPVTNFLTIDTHLGVQAPIWIMAIVFVIALVVQRFTHFGRNLFAVGGSLTAARLSGIRVERTLFIVFGLSGMLAALGGILDLGLAGAGSPQGDPTVALTAIAAVLIGGTSLFGGSGSVVGTAIGVLFIGVLQNSLSLSGVSSDWQQVITGVILVAAVAALPGASGTRIPLKESMIRLKTRWRTSHSDPNASERA